MNSIAKEILNKYNKANQFGDLIKMNYTMESPGKISYTIKVTPKLLATPKAMHGGAIAGFMDAVIGVAALSAVAHEGKVVSTIEYKINFLKPAVLNDHLVGEGIVINKGKRIIVAEGKISNQNKELIATAIGTLNAYPIEKSDFI